MSQAATRPIRLLEKAKVDQVLVRPRDNYCQFEPERLPLGRIRGGESEGI